MVINVVGWDKMKNKFNILLRKYAKQVKVASYPVQLNGKIRQGGGGVSLATEVAAEYRNIRQSSKKCFFCHCL